MINFVKTYINNMKKLIALLIACASAVCGLMAQPHGAADDWTPQTREDVVQMKQGNLMIIDINEMDPARKNLINAKADEYRRKISNNSGDRGIIDIAGSMLTGGISSIVTVVSDEIIRLTKIRSIQKKKWHDMRDKECMFVDSLNSIGKQYDFYGQGSTFGPLDPTDIKFDGITFTSIRDGQEVLHLVYRLDVSKLDKMFMHSKFHLVLDSLAFYPYRSYLPNLNANRVGGIKAAPRPGEKKRELKKREKKANEYYDIIRKFNYDELQKPSLNIHMELTSSWINELVQVFDDVKLGEFDIEIPIPEMRDSVYIYSRANTAEKDRINVNGDCFVVPRSYMPVASGTPSWGTGEYKMKVVMSQKAKMNPDGKRSKNWHKDYKRLVRLQNGGKNSNDYWEDIKTTFIDKSGVIMKATYTPLLNLGAGTVTGLVSGATSAQSKSSSPDKTKH